MLIVKNLGKSGNINSKTEMTHIPEKSFMVLALGLLLCIFTFLT